MTYAPRVASSLPEGYRLIDGPPEAEHYNRLRALAGLGARTPEQASAGLHGAWWALHIVDDAGIPVAMGRVLGDGGWYFHIIDMAVDPAHQRRGLGAAVLDALLTRIRDNAPPGAYVCLMADEPGRHLYRSFGFEPSLPASEGMKLLLKPLPGDAPPTYGLRTRERR